MNRHAVTARFVTPLLGLVTAALVITLAPAGTAAGRTATAATGVARTLAGGVAAGASTGAVAGPVSRADRARPAPAPVSTTKPSSPAMKALTRELVVAGAQARKRSPLPRRLTPAVPDLAREIMSARRLGAPHCSAEMDDVGSAICRYGKVGSARRWVLLGDSHMAMFLEPIAALAAEKGVEVVPLTKQRCLPVDVLAWQPLTRRPYTSCRRHNAWAMRQVKRLRPTRIIVSSLWIAEVLRPGTRRPAAAGKADRLFLPGTVRTLRKLRKVTPHVTVLGPTPVLPARATTCLTTRKATRGSCLGPLRKSVLRRHRLLATAAQRTGSRFAPMYRWFCDAKNTCPAVVGSTVVYADQDHVTAPYARKLKPVLRRALG